MLSSNSSAKEKEGFEKNYTTSFYEALNFPVDSPELIYPFNENESGGLYGNKPSNIKTGYEYDPETGTYTYSEKLGERDYRRPELMTYEEYLQYDLKKANREYWKQKSLEETQEETKGFAPSLKVNSKAFESIFGGNTIDIRPQGTAEIKLGVNISRRDNPILPVNQRRTTIFDFDERIQLNVIGNIGDKMKLTTSFNTEATFDFENQMKVEYTGYEDEILQKIEAGNVSLPLKGSLITGSQTLFGIKTEMKFGRLTVTSILSQEKGEKKDIEITGGAQIQKFEKSAADYEANKHYFLSQYFRDNYETALASPPVINSRVTITKVEVWKTNTNFTTQNTRNVLAFMDLGEGDPTNIFNKSKITSSGVLIPTNNSNNLYANLNGGYAGNFRNTSKAIVDLTNLGFVNATDYEIVENAILLDPSQYTLNPQLGYISLNTSLQNDQVLAVAFQYTYNGRVYQVGEFSTDGITPPDALQLKLVKGTNLNTKIPLWDLMMKNVYSIGAYNLTAKDFIFNVWYLNTATGVEIPFIPEGSVKSRPLITVLNLDKINTNSLPYSDGVFDFIPNVTVNPQNGRIYFPVLEPFGSHLRRQFSSSEAALADKYAFDSLYTTTQTLASQDANKNRFTFKGQYSSSTSSDISLNALNIPQGSIVVTAGGRQLVENVDYTVDYNLGRVKILNEGILQSGQSIKISLQNNSLFAVQTKGLMGSRFDYKFNDKLNVGGTILNYSERPITRKISIGNEPVNNTIWGVDGTYTTEAPILTRIADLLPLYSTKEMSSLTVQGEFAHLLPGNSRAIGKDGTSYIDDFEGSQSSIDMRSIGNWVLASTPQKQTDLFPEGNLVNDVTYGYNRAKLAWYIIDPLFWRADNTTPEHIKNDNDIQSNHYQRQVLETEVFPNKNLQNNIVTNISMLDLAYYPEERGPYNYDVQPTAYSAGLDPTTGKLASPTTRWGGIMRKVDVTDFESSNIQYVQFWMMDPFNPEDGDPNHSGGDLYLNLGNISEDILRDGKKSFENGLPTNLSDAQDLSGDTISSWGRVPAGQSLVNAFDNNADARPFQDVGLDGLRDEEEAQFFTNYLNAITGFVNASAQQQFTDDPSGDNFHYFRGTDYDNQQLDILERYKMFNGMEGNSPTDAQSTESYPTNATTLPDVEDINQTNNLDQSENYFQYRIRLTPQDVNPNNIGNNYITNVASRTVNTPNGSKTVNWYQFKIPVFSPDKVVGDINDFRSIRFMRIFLKGFSKPVIVRFARVDLLRGEWRKYNESLLDPGEYIGTDDGNTAFDINAVNLEENSDKDPVNYVIPPEIQREIDPSNSFGTIRQLNEQSLQLNVCNLNDGDVRAAFRKFNLDIRRYKRIKAFAHVNVGTDGSPLNDGDVSLIVRFGTDFNNNYYEYEIPMRVTPPGNYDTNNETDQRTVWPLENELDLEFQKFLDLKLARNADLLVPGSGASNIKAYEKADGNNTIRVKGNPNLAEVEVIMFGIKNPKAGPDRPNDDGLAKCAELWVNELRLSEFDNKGGWATIGRATAQVADLGTVTLSGAYSTPGFGSIEQKVNERQQEYRKSYDLSTNVELGKFVPEKINVSIPMYYGVSEGWVQPRFNPLAPDLEFDEFVQSVPDREQQDSIKVRSETYNKTRSINFTNVRKNKSPTKKKDHFYDIENFAVSYAYSETFMRDINTEKDFTKTYRGGLTYNYNNNPKNYKPFKSVKFMKGKSWNIVKDFNFYLMPKQFSMQNSIARTYTERKTRNNTGFDFEMPEFYQKNFTWIRDYSLRHDFTKSLTFDYQATNNAIIEEAQKKGGRVDDAYEDEYQEWRDSVWTSVKNFGLNTQFHQGFNFNYNVPINKIPLLNWVTVNTRYSGNFDWQRAPVGADSVGHTLQNSNAASVNGQFNMTTLYHKIPYFKELDQRRKTKKQIEDKRKKRKEKREKKKEERKAKREAKKGGEPLPPKQPEKKEEKKPEESKEEKKNKNDKIPFRPQDELARMILSVKNLSFTYSNNRGTSLPGYRFETYMMGFESGFNAPSYPFVLGFQEPDYLSEFSEKNWLVRNPALVYNYGKTQTENYSARATIRPWNSLRIELNANKNYSENFSQPYYFNDTTQLLDFNTTPTFSGNMSVSYLTWKTAFVNVTDAKKEYFSQVFQNFLDSRDEISQRLGAENDSSRFVDANGYSDGYGNTQQDVLMYAFMAGYSGSDPTKMKLHTVKSQLPLPNWRITFDGLSKWAPLKDIFQSVSLNHGYRSSFNVSSFTRNLNYQGDDQGNAYARDMINGNIISENLITGVSISEQLSPLIGIDTRLKNSLNLRFEYRKDRNVSLSMANNQVTLTKGNEFVVGTGYKFKNLKLFKVGPDRRQLQSDLDVRTDFSIRDNLTVIRLISDGSNQVTSGQNIWSLKITADYRISRSLNVQAYFDRVFTKPKTSASYPTGNTNAGISLRFNLAQ